LLSNEDSLLSEAVGGQATFWECMKYERMLTTEP
jgi:hypothetical protein